MKIYIYAKSLVANGIKVIVDNFIKACNRANVDCTYTDSIKQCSNKDIVVCYGVKECYECLMAFSGTKIALLIDADTLGYRNKIIFYLKKRHVFHYDFFYCIYGYMRYRKMEKTVCQSYDYIMLVSEHDIKYLCRSYNLPREKFICVPNGAKLPEDSGVKKISQGKLRLGILASWGAKQTFSETAWFVKTIFYKYSSNYDDVTLKLAGRGPFIQKLKNIKDIEIVGEVENLSDFFNDIDLFLSVNPKGCGILNRVLDAFAHKKPILSLDASMTGFENIDDYYISFSDYQSFADGIRYYKTHTERVEQKANEAYDYVKTEYQWEGNYDALIDYVVNKLIV